MDHDAVVRQKLTERYLLGELDPEARDEFEEHYFDCQECALDVRASALFVEQSKVVLAEETAQNGLRARVPAPAKPGWMDGLRSGFRGILRPAFVLPVMALLLAVIGYQNLVTYPQLQEALNRPQVLPWASVNIGAYGSEGPTITTRPGKGFLLLARIPPESGYSYYKADLYNPAGKVESSLTFAAPASLVSQDRVTGDTPVQDRWSLQIPGADRVAGSYTLKIYGITSAGGSKEVGQASFELQIQK